MIRLDPAALVKLVREEDETRALVTWLNERSGQCLAIADLLVTSGKDVSAFVAYDTRLAEVARARSFPVVAPGAEV